MRRVAASSMPSSSSCSVENVVSAPQKPAPSSSRRYPRTPRAITSPSTNAPATLTRNVAHGHCPGAGGQRLGHARPGERSRDAADEHRRQLPHGRQYRARAMSRSGELMRLATAGSVDDGKSTLIGRLLYDSKALMADEVRARRGRPRPR